MPQSWIGMSAGRESAPQRCVRCGFRTKSLRREARPLPVQGAPAAADAVRRHERAPVAHRQSLLVELVAQCKGQLIGPEEKLVADAIAKLVLHPARGENR